MADQELFTGSGVPTRLRWSCFCAAIDEGSPRDIGRLSFSVNRQRVLGSARTRNLIGAVTFNDQPLPGERLQLFS